MGNMWGRKKKSQIGIGERDVRKEGAHTEKEAQRGGEKSPEEHKVHL